MKKSDGMSGEKGYSAWPMPPTPINKRRPASLPPVLIRQSQSTTVMNDKKNQRPRITTTIRHHMPGTRRERPPPQVNIISSAVGIPQEEVAPSKVAVSDPTEDTSPTWWRTKADQPPLPKVRLVRLGSEWRQVSNREDKPGEQQMNLKQRLAEIERERQVKQREKEQKQKRDRRNQRRRKLRRRKKEEMEELRKELKKYREEQEKVKNRKQERKTKAGETKKVTGGK